MTPDQIDIALSELETRVDRLRSLYEQYFMGIERMEPHVPRKDVERRFNELRKIPFRNTAKRFKFQTLVQRYNTMQQYWQRICREIENGTYKRHKLRAEKAFGNVLDNPVAHIGVGLTEKTSKERPTDQSEELGQLFDAMDEDDRSLHAALAEAEAAVDAKSAQDKGKGLLAQLDKRQGATTETVRKSPGILGKLPEIKKSEGLERGEDTSAREPTDPARPKLPPRPEAREGTNPLRPPTPPPVPPRTSTSPTPPAPPRAATSPNPPGPPPRTATSPNPPGSPPRPAAQASLSEDRIRSLHKDYLDARARTNATPVSFEKLAQNLRETEKKLRSEHGGKNVDFEVVVKDGKAILKPKLR